MKAEITPTPPETTPSRRRSLLPASRSSGRVRSPMSPVRSTPCPRIITAMIDTTALLASPDKASEAVTRPSQGRATMISKETTSTRSFSETKSPMVASKTA